MGITELSTVESLLVALSGLVTVFIMLAVLCLMIPVISKVVSSVEGNKAAPAPTASAAPTAAAAPAASEAPAKRSGETYTGEIALIGCDEKTAAMVMAIVSYETGTPLDQLIFHKIKAL